MSDKSKNLGTQEIMAEQREYMRSESTKGRDRYDELAERLWSVTVTMLPNGESLNEAIINAVAAKLRTANQATNHWFEEANREHNQNERSKQRIEKLKGVLGELCRQVEISNAVDDHGHKLINLQALASARAVLENDDGR